MRLHELKMKGKEFCDSVCSGAKTYEIRKNDRDYQVGDMIKFKAVDEQEQEFSHPINHRLYRIGYVMAANDTTFPLELKKSFTSFSIQEVKDDDLYQVMRMFAVNNYAYDEHSETSDPVGCRKYNEVVSAINKHVDSNTKVLHVGCGNGVPYGIMMCERARAYTGIDLNTKKYNEACENMHNATVFNADILNMFVAEQYDVIFMLDVLEHFPSFMISRVFSKLQYLLNPHGRILILADTEDEELVVAQNSYGRQMLTAKHSVNSLTTVATYVGFKRTITKASFDDSKMWLTLEHKGV